MTDAAPATPVPAVDPTPAAPSIVHRAATAVADGAANAWSALVAYAPSINALLMQVGIPVLAALLGASGVVGYQKITAPHLVIQAADPPKTETPMRVVIEPLDAIKAELAALRAQATIIDGKLDKLVAELKPAMPPKRTKTAVTK